jgi:hypothetical protein
MIEVSVHMAVEDDNVSVRHLWCCGTLLRGRLMRFMRFSVCVNHGSTLELRTTLTEVARGAKAAAEAGRSCGGIEERVWECRTRGFVERLIAAEESRRPRLVARGAALRETKVRMKEQNEV